MNIWLFLLTFLLCYFSASWFFDLGGVSELLDDGHEGISYLVALPPSDPVVVIKRISLDTESLPSEGREIASQDLWWGRRYERIPPVMNGDDDTGGFVNELVELAKIHESYKTSVYAIRNPLSAGSLPLVIKYTRYCRTSMEPVNPLLVEMQFLFMLDKSGLAPRLSYYSDPFTVELVHEGLHPPENRRHNQWSGGKIRTFAVKCLNNELPEIWYLIMESGTVSLQRFVNQFPIKLGILEIVNRGISLFEQLRKLHNEQSVVHGNILSVNIVVSARDPNSHLFVDWKSARVIGEQKKDQLMVTTDAQSGKLLCHAYASPWEVKHPKEKPSFRDDFYRLTMVLAMMIHGNGLAVSIVKSCVNPQQYLYLKEESNIFNQGYVTLDNAIGTPLATTIQSVSDMFMEILNVARRPASANDKPNYNEVIKHLKNISRILTNEIVAL